MKEKSCCSSEKNECSCRETEKSDQKSTKSKCNLDVVKKPTLQPKIDRLQIYDDINFLPYETYAHLLSIRWINGIYTYIESINDNTNKQLEVSTNTYDQENRKIRITDKMSEDEFNNILITIDFSQKNKIGIVGISLEVDFNGKTHTLAENLCVDIARIMNSRFLGNLQTAYENYIKSGKVNPLFDTTLSALLGETIGDLVDNFSKAIDPVMKSTFGHVKHITSLTLGDESIITFYR
jgi:hypothetical protein